MGNPSPRPAIRLFSEISSALFGIIRLPGVAYAPHKKLRTGSRHLPGVRFARYADDAVLHCKSGRQAGYVLDRIRERFRACKLELHPSKTRVVYCKDIKRTGDHPDIQFTFLGYTFRPRKALDKYGMAECM